MKFARVVVIAICLSLFTYCRGFLNLNSVFVSQSVSFRHRQQQHLLCTPQSESEEPGPSTRAEQLVDFLMKDRTEEGDAKAMPGEAMEPMKKRYVNVVILKRPFLTVVGV